ncbi:MAG: BrnT family toxin [Terriglobia bacterium]
MAKVPRLAFDWDDSNLQHLMRHGISRSDFEEAMSNDPILGDFENESGEARWIALGATGTLRVLVLIFTYRGERIRPVTGWDAGRRLREVYFHRKGE